MKLDEGQVRPINKTTKKHKTSKKEIETTTGSYLYQYDHILCSQPHRTTTASDLCPSTE